MNNVPIARVLSPLLENAFIVSARDSIPEARQRVTTVTARGSLMGRGRGRSTATRAQTRSAPRAQQQSSTRGRGRGQNLSKKKKKDVVATTSGNAQEMDLLLSPE
jgi:IS4 transposase